MFSSLKVKLQNILKPFQRRSVSICVQSKVKKIQPKRDQSLSKRNCPQQIDITPKKLQTISDQRQSLDELETITKQILPVQAGTRILENRNNHKWLDFVSDIQSGGGQSDKLLLPTSQQLDQAKNKQESKIKQISNKSLGQPMQILFQTKNEIQTYPQLKQPASEPHQQTKKIEKQNTNTLINWLEQNKPQYFMIKLNKQSKKKIIANQIKKKRLLDYQHQKKQQAKGKNKNLCIVCEEPASIKQSNQLACAHKIHKLCAQIIKWKPKMKCNLCQRKSIKDLIISTNKIKQLNKTRLNLNKSSQKNK